MSLIFILKDIFGFNKFAAIQDPNPRSISREPETAMKNASNAE